MNIEEILIDTFAAHEHLAPSPDSIALNLQPQRSSRPRRALAVTGIAVLVVAIAVAVRVSDNTTGSGRSPAAHTGSASTIPAPPFRFAAAQKQGTVLPQSQRQQAEDFGGPDPNGTQYRLSQDRGKVVILYFWGTWCAPCTPGIVHLEPLYQGGDVAAVGIDVKDAPAAANEFRDANGITFPIVSDPTGRIGRVLGGTPTTALPTTMLIDKTGKVAAIYLGGLDPTALYAAVSGLLGEPS